jgi:hypothetical protein
MTPDWDEDPYPVPYADFQNPQTLNLYGDVQNNPLSRRDETGHVTCDPPKWDEETSTVTAGACHLDATDYLRLAPFVARATLRVPDEQAA